MLTYGEAAVVEESRFADYVVRELNNFDDISYDDHADLIYQLAEQAAIWCKNASDYSKEVGGKPWRYLLIPHGAVAANVTLENLIARFGVTA